MTKIYKFLVLLMLILFAGSVTKVNAQLGLDPNNYSYLTYQMGTSNYSNGAKSGVLPSVSSYNGYSSFLQNPAVMGMAKESDFTFSLINNNINEQSTFLGNSTSESNNSFRLGEFGFVYKAPTYQGSFIIGAGYTTTDIYNRIDNSSAFNQRSSITDYFAEPGSGFETLAFETFAADYVTQTSTSLTSIFRLDTGYRGLDQDFIRRQSGRIGNYSAFISSEIAKSLYAGVSLGYSYGNHRFQNSFLEVDLQNNYNRELIPSSRAGQFTDVESLEFTEDLESLHYGFDLRAGVALDMNFLKIGSSIYLPFLMRIEEDYYTSLQNNLDDGSEPFFFEEDYGIFKYRLRRPTEYQFGLSLGPAAGVEISASARYRDFTELEVDFVSDSDGDGLERITLARDQQRVNEQIRDLYQSTMDYRLGLKYSMNDNTELYGGYAYSPSPSTEFEVIRTQISAGFEYDLSPEWSFTFGGQYTVWNDRSVLYEFDNNTSVISEQTSLRSQLFNVIAGIRYTFR
ncbi:hypothetical protein AB2B38_003805 [Balneola sp. MJW-20]|uniref:hypothetical protein n=1 Tax=Gracilimonas aurantiaca TaxID=3234185 RepID=UPI0034650482